MRSDRSLRTCVSSRGDNFINCSSFDMVTNLKQNIDIRFSNTAKL